MQHVVDTYQCEWKTTLEQPESRRLFRAFINSDQPDETVVMVPERGQIRPALPEEKSVVTSVSPVADRWVTVGTLADIPVNTGMAARLGAQQIAVFHLGEKSPLSMPWIIWSPAVMRMFLPGG